jgi:hypothetical protein
MTARVTWTEEAVRSLGVRTTVEVAGSILGLSRTQSYEAVKAGRFPVPVVAVGRRLVVPTAPLRRLLEMDAPGSAATDPGGNTTTAPSRGTHDNRTSAA